MYLVKYDDVYFLMNDDKKDILNVGDIIYINGVISNATQYHIYNRSKLEFMACKAASLNTLKLALINIEQVELFLNEKSNISFTYKDTMNIIDYAEALVADSKEIQIADIKSYATALKKKILSNIVINIGDIFTKVEPDDVHPYGYYIIK